jgi:hypothetical protein
MKPSQSWYGQLGPIHQWTGPQPSTDITSSSSQETMFSYCLVWWTCSQSR